MVFESFGLTNPKIIESDFICCIQNHSSEEPLDSDENESCEDAELAEDAIKIRLK